MPVLHTPAFFALTAAGITREVFSRKPAVQVVKQGITEIGAVGKTDLVIKGRQQGGVKIIIGRPVIAHVAQETSAHAILTVFGDYNSGMPAAFIGEDAKGQPEQGHIGDIENNRLGNDLIADFDTHALTSEIIMGIIDVFAGGEITGLDEQGFITDLVDIFALVVTGIHLRFAHGYLAAPGVEIVFQKITAHGLLTLFIEDGLIAVNRIALGIHRIGTAPGEKGAFLAIDANFPGGQGHVLIDHFGLALQDEVITVVLQGNILSPIADGTSQARFGRGRHGVSLHSIRGNGAIRRQGRYDVVKGRIRKDFLRR